MAVHGSGATDTASETFPEVVPFTLPRLTRLSWELGSRVVDDDESTLHSEWEKVGTSWSLSLFHVTTHTVLIRVRTPVGRERFFGAMQADLSRALAQLENTSDWEPLP